VIRSRVLVWIALAGCSGSSPPVASHPGPATPPAGAAALAAFETVRAVFQHPRCQNCHAPGDAPLQGDDGQVHIQNVQRGATGEGLVGLECTSCHHDANPPDSYGDHMPPGASKPWRMPTPELPMVFVGIAPGALCQQIKDPARNGGRDLAALRVHLDDPLVLWGWAPGKGRATIPTARAEFLRAWELWTSAGAPCPN
jgi:hypothetical protein